MLRCVVALRCVGFGLSRWAELGGVGRLWAALGGADL